MSADVMRKPGWLHVDLKGIIPDEQRLMQWIDYWSSLGYSGLVIEYEDRLDWATWPGTHRPGFDRLTWQRLWQHIARQGVEVIPLIQTVGHLDWLLYHPSCEHLSESPLRQQICLKHPQTLPLLTRWLDEVIDLHPGLRFVHLGADEAWQIGACPRCAAASASMKHGKAGLLLEHICRLCEHAIGRGVTPMIWADMFLREGRQVLLSDLPTQTLLVNWQYQSTGSLAECQSLRATGRRVIGASAIRCNFELTSSLALLTPRVENVVSWRQAWEDGQVDGVIHTTWGRPMSLSYLYGPWEGWLPAFIAAANPMAWEKCPLKPHLPKLDAALTTTDTRTIRSAVEHFKTLTVDDPWQQQALNWWRLSLDYALIRQLCMHNTAGYRGLQAASVGRAIHWDQLLVFRRQRRELLQMIDVWEAQVRDYWQTNRLSDLDEYIRLRLSGFRQMLEPDWAAGLDMPELPAAITAH